MFIPISNGINYRNRPRNARVVVENNVASFFPDTVYTPQNLGLTRPWTTFQRTLFCCKSAHTLTHFIFPMNVRNNYGQNRTVKVQAYIERQQQNLRIKDGEAGQDRGWKERRDYGRNVFVVDRCDPSIFPKLARLCPHRYVDIQRRSAVSNRHTRRTAVCLVLPTQSDPRISSRQFDHPRKILKGLTLNTLILLPRSGRAVWQKFVNVGFNTAKILQLDEW